MKFVLRVPRTAIRCAGCLKTIDHPFDARSYGDRLEVEIPCSCPIPVLQLAFFYPESAEPLAAVDLEGATERRIRAGNDALAGTALPAGS